MADGRIQDWRARQRVVAKMIDSAFNGDAPDEDSRVEFALITMAPNGDVLMVKNIDDHLLFGVFLQIIATKGCAVDDEAAVGHA